MRVISSTAPMPSMEKASTTMRIVSETMPCRPSSLRLLEITRRSLKVMRRLSRIRMMVLKVMNPRPPIWIRVMRINCPRKVRSFPGSITVRPVTQTAEVAVNNASIKARGSWVLHTGMCSSSAPSRISPPKPNISTREGEVIAFLTRSRESELGLTMACNQVLIPILFI